jgi:ABC-type histidine transport system ATPase subunit
MDMLRVTALCKRFGDKEVLRGLDLAVPNIAFLASSVRTVRAKPQP